MLSFRFVEIHIIIIYLCINFLTKLLIIFKVCHVNCTHFHGVRVCGTVCGVYVRDIPVMFVFCTMCNLCTMFVMRFAAEQEQVPASHSLRVWRCPQSRR